MEAIFIEELIRRSEPYIKNITPIIIKNTDKNMEYSLLFISYRFNDFILNCVYIINVNKMKLLSWFSDLV